MNNINKINLNLDEYFLNPYKYSKKNEDDNNLLTNSNELNEIINSLTKMVLSNSIKNSFVTTCFNPILFKLVANNNIIKLENTLKFNKNINIDLQDKDGDTPLHIAVFLCNIEAVKILLKYNANPIVKDKWGQISIHRLCFCMGDSNTIEMINLFIKFEKKNFLNIFNTQDNYGNTPIHLILKHIIKNNINMNEFHIKLINKLKILTDNNLYNIDNQSIEKFLKILKL